MAKENANEKELERQEKVAETVSKTDRFFRENKKAIYGCLIALLVIGLAIMAYYKLYYQPKSEEAARQMYPAEASFRDGEFDLALNGDGNTLGFAQIIGRSVFSASISIRPIVVPVVAVLVALVTLIGSIPAVRMLLNLRPTEVLHGR